MRLIIIFQICSLITSYKDDHHTDVFAAPGSHVVLPMEVTLRKDEPAPETCDSILWKHETISGFILGEVEDNHCYTDESWFRDPYDLYNNKIYRISLNGSLEIRNVKWWNAGRYTVKVITSNLTKIHEKTFTLHVQRSSDDTEIFAAPGSDIVLPIDVTLYRNRSSEREYECVVWTYETLSNYKVMMDRYCRFYYFYQRRYFYIQDPFQNNYKLSQNGTLVLYNVTSRHAGIYTSYVIDGSFALKHEKTFIIFIQVSEPFVNITCDTSGSAVILCEIQNGTDVTYTWTVNSYTLPELISSRWSVSGNQLVLFSPGPWNISCSVRNRVSEEHSLPSFVSCPGYRKNTQWINHLCKGLICVMYTLLLVCLIRDLMRGTRIPEHGI
ncbi:uncharacterized protein LOC128652800 isoform X2 [Bombina bombina]|uniref:uncharacterized protein LOC128652800 isoform X2 n=1 Tax=Bombina bombina TaxID=8345 RepID=UPI00235A8314|nr:uncharacterized protein LOC128652800 isoform X2 [Bombina bombina]